MAHIKDVIATTEEVNILHGIEITTEELNRLKGLLVTAEELNKLAGLDISIDDLNSVVNKLDKNPPITAGTYTKVKVDEKGLVVQGQELSESDVPSISLSKVYDVTVSNNVLNKLAGLEVGSTELNQLKNIEGNVQTQIDKYVDIIPDEATLNNQLADKKFVRDWVYDHAGYYVTKMPNGTPFTSKQELVDTVTFYHLGEVKRLSENDFAVVEKDETQGYQMAVYIYDRDDIYNEGHWILQYIIPRDAGYITDVIMNGVLQPVTNNIVNLGTVITKHQDISGKQDIIPDLDTIRKGASKGATALQYVPAEYVTETELNNKGYLTSYTETDPIYTADKPNIATKYELTEGLSTKQDIIPDLDTIRKGASKGATALQSIPSEYVTENELTQGLSTKQDVINDLDEIRSGANKGATALQSYIETDPVYTADKPNIALKSEIPTKVSSLTNDSNYQTYADVASMITSVTQFEIKIVDSLPSSGQKMVLYLIPKTSVSGDDIYDEYIWIESTSSFELVGSTTANLSDYYSKSQTDELLNAKQNTISDLDKYAKTDVKNNFTMPQKITTDANNGLEIYSSNVGGYLFVTRGGEEPVQMAIKSGKSGGTFGTTTNHQFQFRTNDTARMIVGVDGSVTLNQNVPSDSNNNQVATTKWVNAKGYLTSYTETDPIYTADKPNIALKSEIPDITNLATKAELQNGLNNKQAKLTAGTGISISGNTISNTLTSLDNYTTYSDEKLNSNQAFIYKSSTGEYLRGNFNNFINTFITPTFALKADLPTKTSQLTNDSNFVTQNSLLEKKTETWTFTLEDGTEVTKTMVLGA